jgi:hypothetical protein
MSVRNAGNGMAVVHGWIFHPVRMLSNDHPDPGAFRRLTRDIYVPAASVGFWQGVMREPGTEEFIAAHRAITARETMTVDLLYGDHEGGQRIISRFAMLPTQAGGWLASVGRHWSIDGRDPREEERRRRHRGRRRR